MTVLMVVDFALALLLFSEIMVIACEKAKERIVRISVISPMI